MCCCCLKLFKFLVLVIAVLLIVGILFYRVYLRDWGEKVIENQYALDPSNFTLPKNLNLPDAPSVPNLPSNISFPHIPQLGNLPSSCPYCKGIDNFYPTNSTGFYKFLDTKSSKAINSMIITAISTSFVGSILSLVSSNLISGAGSSNGITPNGFFETFHIIGHAQFSSLLGTLQMRGCPRFFYEYSSQLSWTNLQIRLWEPGTHSNSSANNQTMQNQRRRRLFPTKKNESLPPTVTGVRRYAWYLGIEPTSFIYLTAVTLAVILVAIWSLYFLFILILYLIKKYTPKLADTYQHKAVGISIQLLLLSHYGLALAATFEIYLFFHEKNVSVGGFFLAVLLLTAFTIGLIVFGIYVIYKYKHELEDIGTIKHQRKIIYSKYGPYYQDYNKENKFFFAAKAIVDVSSGIIVGVIQMPELQIMCLIVINLLYLMFIVWREPYLLRMFFYISMFDSMFRLFYLLITLVMVNDNVLPLFFRNGAAYLIIGTNALIFLCLFVRQCYCIYLLIYNYCKTRKYKKNQNHSDDLLSNQNQDNQNDPEFEDGNHKFNKGILHTNGNMNDHVNNNSNYNHNVVYSPLHRRKFSYNNEQPWENRYSDMLPIPEEPESKYSRLQSDHMRSSLPERFPEHGNGLENDKYMRAYIRQDVDQNPPKAEITQHLEESITPQQWNRISTPANNNNDQGIKESDVELGSQPYASTNNPNTKNASAPILPGDWPEGRRYVRDSYSNSFII